MRIPFTEFLRAAYGGRSHASYLLVTIETDEGTVGYGEDLASYQALKLGVYPWGQGPAMRAIAEELAARN
jgi:L-alanine-DL-glutamate epimerase-like enolase superfamily enzyme